MKATKITNEMAQDSCKKPPHIFKSKKRRFSSNPRRDWNSAICYEWRSGRFVGEDPAPSDYKKPQNLNPFRYCDNNPIINVDPDGRETDLSNGVGGEMLLEFGKQINATTYSNPYGHWPGGAFGKYVVDSTACLHGDIGNISAHKTSLKNLQRNSSTSAINGGKNNEVAHSAGGMFGFWSALLSNLSGHHVDTLITNASPMIPGTKEILMDMGTKVKSNYFVADPVSYLAAGFDLLTPTGRREVWNPKNWYDSGERGWFGLPFTFKAHSPEIQHNLAHDIRNITGD